MEPTCNQFPRLSRDPSNFNLGNRLEISFESKLTIPTCIVTPPNSLDDYRVSLEESSLLLLLLLLLRLTDNNEIAIKFLMRRRIEEGEKDRRFDLFGDRWIYIRRDRERERETTMAATLSVYKPCFEFRIIRWIDPLVRRCETKSNGFLVSSFDSILNIVEVSGSWSARNRLVKIHKE